MQLLASNIFCLKPFFTVRPGNGHKAMALKGCAGKAYDGRGRF